MASIIYRFKQGSEPGREYPVHLAEPGQSPSTAAVPREAEWTALEFHRCPFCPLRVEEQPACPAAVQLAHLLEHCRGLDSFEEVYLDMQVLNRHLAFRLRDASKKDAAVNAIILLDVLAKAFPPDIHEELTEELGPLFEGFLADL